MMWYKPLLLFYLVLGLICPTYAQRNAIRGPLLQLASNEPDFQCDDVGIVLGYRRVFLQPDQVIQWARLLDDDPYNLMLGYYNQDERLLFFIQVNYGPLLIAVNRTQLREMSYYGYPNNNKKLSDAFVERAVQEIFTKKYLVREVPGERPGDPPRNEPGPVRKALFDLRYGSKNRDAAIRFLGIQSWQEAPQDGNYYRMFDTAIGFIEEELKKCFEEVSHKNTPIPDIQHFTFRGKKEKKVDWEAPKRSLTSARAFGAMLFDFSNTMPGVKAARVRLVLGSAQMSGDNTNLLASVEYMTYLDEATKTWY